MFKFVWPKALLVQRWVSKWKGLELAFHGRISARNSISTTCSIGGCHTFLLLVALVIVRVMIREIALLVVLELVLVLALVFLKLRVVQFWV